MNGSFLMSVKPAFLKSTVSHPTSTQASVKMVARLPPSYSACAYRCDWRQNDMASLTLLPTAEHMCVTSPKLTCYSEGNSQVYYAAPVGKGYKKPGAKKKKNPKQTKLGLLHLPFYQSMRRHRSQILATTLEPFWSRQLFQPIPLACFSK